MQRGEIIYFAVIGFAAWMRWMSSGCYFSVQHTEAIHYLSDRVPA